MPATTRTFRGDAVAIPQVTKITAPSVTSAVAFTINGKTLSFSSWVIATIVNTWNGATTVIDPVSQTEEFSAITASASGNDLILTSKTAGVPFIVTTTLGGTAVSNEIQTITIGNGPTGGTFTLTFNGNTTSAIAYNATAAAVQTALQALASIGSGNATVSGNAGGPYTVTFVGTLAGANQPAITASATNLTGGNAAANIVTLQDGQVSVNEVQTLTINGSPTGGTFTVSFAGQTTAAIAYNASAATFKTAFELLANVGSGNTTVTGGPLPGTALTITFQGSLAGLALPLITVDPTNLTGVVLSVTVTTTTPGVNATDLVVNLVMGDRVWNGTAFIAYRSRYTNLSANEYGTLDVDRTSSAAEVQACLEELPSIGVGNVSVTKPDGNTHQITFINMLHGNNTTTFRIMAGFLVWYRPAPYFDTRYPSTVIFPTTGTNEVQTITSAGTQTAGSFTLTFSGQTTGPIPYNASAATVKTALEALSNIGAGSLTAGGGSLPGTPVTITFSANGLNGKDVAQMTSDITALRAPVVMTTNGFPGLKDTQTVTLTGNAFSGTLTLTISAQTTSALQYNASAANVQTALEGLAAIGAGNVICTGGPWPALIQAAFAVSKGNVAQMTATLSLNNATITDVETVQGGLALSPIETTPSAGPNHWDDPTNWSPAGVPDSGDITAIETGNIDLLYGLQQRATFTASASADTLTLSTGRKTFRAGQKVRVRNSGGALPGGLAAATDYYVINPGTGSSDAFLQLSATLGGAAIDITSAGSGTHTIEVVLSELRASGRWSGKLGLPLLTVAGNREYRSTYLQIGASIVTIGTGQGSGAGRFKLDTGGVPAAIAILDTGGSVESAAPALIWKGAAAGNTLSVLSGDVGVGLYQGDTTTLANFIQRGGTVELGDDVTITGPIDKTGGTLLSNQADVAGALQLR